jgi:hypothetical protein
MPQNYNYFFNIKKMDSTALAQWNADDTDYADIDGFFID